MSLRAFHLLFIALSIVLAAFLAAWAVGQYRTGHDAAYLGAGVASLGSAAALALYAVTFQRKTRGM
jgi:hypothetical protein